MVQNLTNNSVILIDEANNALSVLSPLVIKIVIAILILLLGFVIGNIAKKLVLKFFQLSDFDRILKKKTGFKFSLSVTISTIISYLIYIIAIIMALNRLELATTIVTTIIIILILVLILFVIFGLNDIFANFSAGIIIKIKGNIKPGDYIRIKDKRIEGYIIDTTALNIRLETKKDEIVFIPNMVLFKSEIVKPKNIPKH
jgi:small conductance mechanosensitive channel